MWFAVGLALVLTVLLIPLRISIVATPREKPLLESHIEWLFGLVRFRIDRRGMDARSDRGPREPTAKSMRRSLTQGRAFLRTPGSLGRTRRFVQTLVESLRPEVEWLYLELGTGDPADTGQAWALLGPLSSWLAYRYQGRVLLVPDFVAANLAIDGRAHLTIVPLSTMAILFGYLLSPVTLRAVYEAHRAGQR